MKELLTVAMFIALLALCNVNSQRVYKVGNRKEDESSDVQGLPLTTIFFATESNPQFCALLKTALLNEQNIHVVGWNLNRSRKGFVKVKGQERSIVQITPTVVASYVCTLPKDGAVLGADAFDTLFSAYSKPSDILNSFSKLNSNFVWSAERKMWPKFSTLPYFVKKHYSAQRLASGYRYLNYGGWIGRVKEACEILSRCSRQLVKCEICGCSKFKHCKHPRQDQGAAHIVHASSKKPRSILDHKQTLFHPAYPRCQNLRVQDDGRVQVEGASSSTHMYHFNGNSKHKSGCSGHYKNGWFANLEKPSEVDDHITLVGSENQKFSLPVSEICPYIWLKNFSWVEPMKFQKHRYKINIRDKVHAYNYSNTTD